MADGAALKPPKPAREETPEEQAWRKKVDKEVKKYVKFAKDEKLAGWRHFPKGILGGERGQGERQKGGKVGEVDN